MKVVALVSGGKDSCYAMMRCIDYGHEIVALANLLPEDDAVDELDSYMYQTVGHQIVISYAECMGLPLFRRRIQGTSSHKDLHYNVSSGDEVEDMYILLNEVKRQIPSITAVCSGAIASDYQRLRVENVCSRLNLVSLAYLWKQDQALLLEEMVERGIVAIVIKVAAMGLDPAKHLSKEVAELQGLLFRLKELYGINICGEGGEYESLTLDCPLFKNARIILDNFQVISHSIDSIAPAGILHPLSFHLESKVMVPSITNEMFDISSESKVIVHEVQESSSNNALNTCSVDLASSPKQKLCISSAKGSTFSVGCWISSSSSEGLQEDLAAVLRKVELHLAEENLGWENVLYIHLYISDMMKFNLANEVYLKYISEQKCYLGVPSRSTIELPLIQVGLGNAYVEVLVANNPNKRVLHVQSISCWAPCCIGPYSQATLHKEILFMAGQLGLDPPTMLLHRGGPTAELEQALVNCEAVAECFNCSVVSSSIFLVIYCSTSLAESDRIDIQHRIQKFFCSKTSDSDSVNGGMSDVSSPIYLYILAPDLPKRASVEIKPILYIPDLQEVIVHTTMTNDSNLSHTKIPCTWDFGHFASNDSCCQKFIISGKICAAVISIIDDVAVEICSVTKRDATDQHFSYSPEHLQKISRFCVYLLHRTLLENEFGWSDLMSLRIYVATTFCVKIDMLNVMVSLAFAELADIDNSIHKEKKEAIFSLIPVPGAGRSASMSNLITCEMLASKL